ncbi:MAG: hypothetical protein H6625_01465 [Bdellovibrionaceae bacterium]|nr:hypothetical protein [Pseudobdellovibrionaceae bacterium]
MSEGDALPLMNFCQTSMVGEVGVTAAKGQLRIEISNRFGEPIKKYS